MAANRYIERYKKDLQKEEKQRQSSLAWNNRNKILKGAAIGLGAAFAIHQAHPKGILGAIDSISRPINAGAGAFQSTMGKYVSGYGHGVLKGIDTAKNSIDVFNNPKSAIDHFQSTYKKLIDGVDDLHIDKLRKEKNNIISEIKGSLRRDSINQSANKKLDEIINDESIDSGIRKATLEFKKGNSHKLARLADLEDRNEIGYILEEISNINKKSAKSAQDLIFSSLTMAKKDVNLDDLENIKASALDKMMESITERQQSEASFIKRKFNKLAGYRRASANDLLDFGDEFLTEENKKFLNTLQINYGADLNKFVVDENLYMYKGKLVDSRNFKKLGRNIRSGFSGGILGHLGYQRDLMMMDDYAKRAGTLIRSGYNVPTLEGTGVVDSRGVLKESLLAVGDKIYRLNNMSEPLVEGYHLASGRYGSTKRLISSMSGVNSPDWSNERTYNWLFDVGGDRQPGLMTKFKSIFTKSKDPKYMPNKVERIVREASLIQEAVEKGTAASSLNGLSHRDIRDLNLYMQNQTSGFGHEILDKVLKDLDNTRLKNISFETEDDLIDAYVKISKEYSVKNTSKLERVPEDDELRASAVRILNSSTQKKNKRLFAGNQINTGQDRLRRIISERLTDIRGKDNTLKVIEDMFQEGSISGNQFIESNKFMASFNIKSSIKGTSIDKEKMARVFSGKEDPYVLMALEDMLKESHPKVGFGRIDDFHESFRGDVLPVKKFNPRILNDWKSVLTGGRGDMASVNKGTLLSYGMLHRLNDMVRHFDFMPLAMSDDSMGSPLSTAKNIMFKRVMPIYAGFTALKYTSDYWSEISGSGYTLEQHYERGKANATLRLSRFKDATGITNAFKFFDEVTPGSEGIKTSINQMPFMGPLAPVSIGAAALDSVGVFSGRSEEEWVDYFANGEDPVRKGRYWILGSTPWMGESITHYEPNSYRQAMAQWEYTDTVYGSRENYWAHSWMPTPTEPLAPIKRFVTDRYWFEKMHLKDRPYPLTGEMFDPNTPWGTILNPTIGRILKPQFKLSAGATKEDLEKIAENNAYAKDVISRFSGGDLTLSTYIPKYTMSSNVAVATGGGAIGSGDVMINGVAGAKANTNADGLSAGGPGRANAAIRLTEDSVGNGLVVNGKNYSLQDLKNINQSIIDKSGKITEVNKKSILNTGFTLPYYEPRAKEELDLEVQKPTDIGYSMERTLDIFKDITGARGFLASMAMGGDDYGEGQAVLATSADAYASSARFWDSSFGGRGGELSEVFRRFINKRPGLYKTVNNIPNTMPGWLPERFRTGDAYKEVPRGEIRLPGEAYESMNKLHPDEFGRYGAVDRAAILADVAPYSTEYKLWSKIASEQNLSKEAKDFLAQAKEQKEEQNKKYHMTPYKFLGQDVERKTAVIEKFIDSSRFVVKGDEKIYRLAGVNTNFNPETEEGRKTLNILENTMVPGSEVSLVSAADSNPKDTIPAVVYSQRQNVNKSLIKSGIERKEEDGVIDTYVSLGSGGRALGKIWEAVAHAPIPIVHNKFFNVRSPMEHYKDYQVYGKEWQSWNEPVDDLLVPSFQSAFARNPFWATLSGATVGAITGLLLGGPSVRKAMTGFGAVTAGVGSVWRSQYEIETGKAWIPKRREEERKIMEYYDLLEYTKNKRLYNKYVDVAKKEEGVDVEEIISEMEEIDRKLKDKERMLEGLSRHFLRFGISKEDTVQKRINSEGRLEYNLTTEKEYIEARRKEVLKELRETRAEEKLVGLGPYARMAVKYRQEYRSTLFGLDESSTFQQMYAAFPRKDREYLEHFSKVSDEDEREEILKIVPKNQQRAYRLLWGMDTEKNSLNKMFGDYALPDKDWVGWKEGVDLEDSMIKLIENQGLDPKDFGFWKDFTESERLTPAPVEVNQRYDRQSTSFIRTRLENVLEDYDINDIDIEITPREDNNVNISFEMVHDIKDKVQMEIQRALGG